MGYYSYHKVADSDIDNLLDVLNQYSAPYEWELDFDNVPYVHGKWYQWLRDMQQLAYAYPDNFLIIVRYGEECPDMSRAIVRNGTVVEEVPSITWPDGSVV